jgi:hypothetical protein
MHPLFKYKLLTGSISGDKATNVVGSHLLDSLKDKGILINGIVDIVVSRHFSCIFGGQSFLQSGESAGSNRPGGNGRLGGGESASGTGGEGGYSAEHGDDESLDLSLLKDVATTQRWKLGN